MYFYIVERKLSTSQLLVFAVQMIVHKNNQTWPYCHKLSKVL